MVLNESSEADVGWQISMPSEDETMDDLDDPERSPGSRWSRRSSHEVESSAIQLNLMDQITGSSELCVMFIKIIIFLFFLKSFF